MIVLFMGAFTLRFICVLLEDVDKEYLDKRLTDKTVPDICDVFVWIIMSAFLLKM